MASWQTYLDKNSDRFLAELFDFARIPSVSALPQHAGDVHKAAEWSAARMAAAGIENVRVLPTGGHPVVYGDWLHAPGQPTVLLYGHFDTQPADPLNLWTNPPFEPTLRDGRIYARGISDDKGNMLIPILAVEALLKTEGKLPINIKCFFEGQEEIGSPQMPAFVAANKKLLACDVALSADGGQWAEDQPAILVGLKGICSIQISMKGAKGDLHSGVYGGAVQNPLHAMAALIASMRSAGGKVMVDGFYDDVVLLSKEDSSRFAAIPFDDAAYMASLGVDALYGEPGYSTIERAWARPTLEVNGMWGGFQGEGVKTVLPSEAHAKISCRLVANQKPAKIIDLLTAHVKKHAQPGVRVTVTPGKAMADPYLMPADHLWNKAAYDVLKQVYGKDPYYMRIGGSVPVCPLILNELGAYTVSFAFGLDDENLHAPDEFFRLKSFTRGQAAYCLMLKRMAKT